MQSAIGDMRMHWREAGDGDPLIFIHGFPFTSELWQPQLDAVPAGWHFIAPDLRGFGESDLGTRSDYTMDVLADDMVALMDHLELDQAVITGLSMGGYVELSLALRHPDRVRALVFTATRANADSEDAKHKRRALAMRVRSMGSQAVIDDMFAKLTSGHTKLKYPQVAEKLQAMMAAARPDALTRALDAMAERKDYQEDLSRISVSTLVVRGEQDEIVSATDMEAIARTVPGARQEVIALTGHVPNLEAPDVYNKILTHYLQMLPPALKLGSMDLSW